MKPLTSCALVDLSVDIAWQRNRITHLDHYFVNGLNSWRDALPGDPAVPLLEDGGPSSLTLDAAPGQLVQAYDPGKIVKLPRSRLSGRDPLDFERGRFYPQGLLSGIPGIFKGNMTPFRCLSAHAGGITADLNHPMAGHRFSLTLKRTGRLVKSRERGGACSDWLTQALDGPGMQAGHDGISITLPGRDRFHRQDEAPDPVFYAQDRLVRHVDARASRNLSGWYQGNIRQGSRVLDLMAGFQSHLPEDLGLKQVHGLGLNEAEMSNNRALDAYTVQDLNTTPTLHFDDHTFDAAICSLSVEYLVKPVAVFKETARVLKPGAPFMVTFSNRWFPEKAIGIWEDLHDFERMGLVTAYFNQSGAWRDLSTRSIRGYPRPRDDRHYPKLRYSDPVYMVSGIKS